MKDDQKCSKFCWGRSLSLIMGSMPINATGFSAYSNRLMSPIFPSIMDPFMGLMLGIVLITTTRNLER